MRAQIAPASTQTGLRNRRGPLFVWPSNSDIIAGHIFPKTARTVSAKYGMRIGFAIATICLVAAGGCTLTAPRPRLPEQFTIMRDRLIIHSDSRLPADHRLFEELVAQHADLGQKLDLPSGGEPLFIYLFESPELFRTYTSKFHPELPNRRAFFLETDTRLIVLAHWGDRVAEDLRHEVAHGYLHAVVPNLPLWLDEGLAEYYEVPRGHNGLNRQHVEHLYAAYQDGVWKPDLHRLERLGSAEHLTQLDYAESWAWAHFLMETDPARLVVLQTYLSELRNHGSAGSLAAAIAASHPHPNDALLRYVEYLYSRT